MLIGTRVEMVEVVDTDGQSDLFPKLTPRVATASVDYLNSSLGILVFHVIQLTVHRNFSTCIGYRSIIT